MIFLKRHIKSILLLLIIVVIGFILQYKYLNEFPSHTHAWAQADRYAIANRFIENGFNFFKPETYVLNHQFPDNFKTPSTTSITAVDFPLHDYIVSIIMHLTSTQNPFVFRLYTLVWSFIGLFFLGKISNEITQNYFKTILVVVIATTSPIFCYYQSGFLPTIPSLSCIIVGYYYHILFIKHKAQKFFIISLCFLTIGVLTRMTFIIPFIALMGINVITQLKTRKLERSNIIGYGISLVFILSFMLHNSYLRKNYGSMFLSHLVPASSLSEFFSIVYNTLENWGFSFFSEVNYCFFLLLTLLAFFFRKKTSFNHLDYLLLKTTGICFIGLLAFFVAMALQFPVHDYYLLDTFFFPILILIILLLKKIPVPQLKILPISLIILLAFQLIFNAISFQENRRQVMSWDNLSKSIDRFTGSDDLLDSLNVPSDSKILVFDVPAPNIPFLLMKRRGYMVWSIDTNSFRNIVKTWDYDYLIIENQHFLSGFNKRNLLTLKNFKKVGGNKDLSVLERTNSTSNLANIDFYDKKSTKPFFTMSTGFEKDSSYSQLYNITLSDSIFYEGQFCYSLKCNQTYGLTLKSEDYIDSLSLTDRLLYISSEFYSNNTGNLHLVITIIRPSGNHSYNSYPIQDFITKPGSWNHFEMTFNLTELSKEDKVEIYLHNASVDCSNFYVDNLRISFY